MLTSMRKDVAVYATLLTLLISLVLLARLDPNQNGLASIFEGLGQTKPSVASEPTTATEGEDKFTLHPEDHVRRNASRLEFIWRITSGEARPDGVLKSVYMINGAFPGPTIEARSGDRIVVEVENGLQDEGVSIHWHGLAMRGFNIMDGAAGLTQAAIRPGERFIYDFVIEESQHGTFWYHAHDGVQRADGLYGGFVVHKPVEHYDAQTRGNPQERLLLIGDWYHRPASDALAFYMHPGAFGMETVPDNMLLNGQGRFDCSNAVPARPVDCLQYSENNLTPLDLTSEESHILRIVNVGAYSGFNLSLSDAVLEPVTVDGGHDILSGVVRSVGTLHPGQRLDLLVRSHGQGPSETVRPKLIVQLDDTSFKYENPALRSTQEFPVQLSGEFPNASAESETSSAIFDIQAAKSLRTQAESIPKAADSILVLYAITQKLAQLENEPHGFINGTTWNPTEQVPLLTLPSSQLNSKEHLVLSVPYNKTTPLWVDIVLNNLDEESHPFHMHGHSFYVLSTYSSSFNWGSYNPLDGMQPPGGPYDLTRAVKRDTVLVPRRGYAVLRMKTDNPGLWAFHCHVLWHMASGMATALDIR